MRRSSAAPGSLRKKYAGIIHPPNMVRLHINSTTSGDHRKPVSVAKFPAMTSTMIERGRDQIRRAVDERVKAGKYEEALKLAEDSETLCDFAGINRLDEIVYDSWAKKQIAAQQWEAAAD